MAIRVSAFTVNVGDSLQLSQAQGEDREFNLTFLDPTTGLPVDFTGYQTITLFVKNPATGVLSFSVEHGGFVGVPAAGTPFFLVPAADSATLTPGTYDADVCGVDASGWKTQFLAVSPFESLVRF